MGSLSEIVSEHSDVYLDPDVRSKSISGIILGLIGVAAFMANAIIMLFNVPSHVKVMMRSVVRIGRKARSAPAWGQSRAIGKRVLESLSAKNDSVSVITDEVGIEPRVAFDGRRDRGVSKTKVKIALRSAQVVVGLMTICVSLFSLLSKWEDDPEMVELFVDAKDVVVSAKAAGMSGAAQKITNARLYRVLRNTSGIGGLLPRGGVPLIQTRD